MRKVHSIYQIDALKGLSLRYTRCIAGIIGLIFLSADTFAQDPNAFKNLFEGYYTLRSDYFSVNGDTGRFREDAWTNNKATGGLDRLYLKSRRPDWQGYEWELWGRALYDHDYEFGLRMHKKDSHYFLADFDGFRRYYDGSNEYWDAPVATLAEKNDSDLFVDRRNYLLEYGITLPEYPQFVFGWHRLEKDGREVLLRGAEAVSVGGQTVSAVPVVVDVRGITDTFYAETFTTFDETSHVRIRQEFEQYHQDQRSDLSSFDISGNVDDSDIQRDHLGYTNWRTMLMFDSSPDEETYLTANYMYNYLNNNSTRDITGVHAMTTDQGENSRKANVGSFGYHKDRFGGVEHLALTTGLRLEDSKTESSMSGSSAYYPYTDPAKPRILNSWLDEIRVEEMLRLVYQGYKRTTLSFDMDLEQRDLNWFERDQHGGAFSDSDNSRRTDIMFFDQEYTWKAVHRFNSKVRMTALFQMTDRDRNYSELLDDTLFYPGYLGDYRITGNEVMFKMDWRMNSQFTSSLKYQLIREHINTELGGRTQDLEIHRGSGNIAFYPASNLYMATTFMVENYRLNTPAVGKAVNHAQGTSPYDFEGNLYSILLDGTYVLSDKSSFDFGIQHTEALGKVDYAGDYMFDRLHIAMKRKMARNQIVSVGYEFINFNNRAGSFDDYRGHGVSISYTCSF